MTDIRGRIPMDERPHSYDYENRMQSEPEHGHEDHTGYRCSACASESQVQVLIHPNTGDYWQSKQISWQEACDVIFRAFDDATAEHFPVHLPVNCKDCPEKPILPIKPVMPSERAVAQATRIEYED